MVFNSFSFLIFIAAFLSTYFFTYGRGRLWLCLLGSYLFYGWWDWRFLSILGFATTFDFILGSQISQAKNKIARKSLLTTSIVVNLGILSFFKYFNFFLDSLQSGLQIMGFAPSFPTFNVLLPIGISFYTFQSMSYTIDIYKKEIEPEESFLRYATFVAFFPQLVAGPIVRAKEFLPQLRKDSAFNWHALKVGFSLCLLGYFKKMVVADSLASVVDSTFQFSTSQSSINLLIGVIFYTFQIYCDFSGYTDIARGLATILGFSFPENFCTPYFSRNFSEFWTRWHISLSSWLKDYLYIPLGGSRYGTLKTYRNVMLTMLVGGLWHGANITFIVWGFLHGIFLITQRLLAPGYNKFFRILRCPLLIQNTISTSIVFFLTVLAWIFFRSVNLYQAIEIISDISKFEFKDFSSIQNKFLVAKGFLVIGFLLCFDLAQTSHRMRNVAHRPAIYSLLCVTALLLISLFGTFNGNQFIYFQF